jgi:hypothetical protein
MMQEKQFLKDLLAYVKFVDNDNTLDAGQKYHNLILTISHDLHGVINEERCFAPRVTGYAQAELIEMAEIASKLEDLVSQIKAVTYSPFQSDEMKIKFIRKEIQDAGL